jgi:hypothetical protein
LETRDYALIRHASASRLFDLVDRLVRGESKSRHKGKFHAKKKRAVLKRVKPNKSFHRTCAKSRAVQ